MNSGKVMLVAFIASLGLVHPAFCDLIVNGDFEAFNSNFVANLGSPITNNGWTFSNQAGVEGSGNPNRSARLESNGSTTSDPTIAQIVSGLTVGESYRLA